MNNMNKMTKLDLLQKCKELGIKRVSSKNKNVILLLIKEYEFKNMIEPNVTPVEHLKEVYDYLPYNDDDIDYLYNRNLDDIITDEVNWTCFPKEMLSIMKKNGKEFINLAERMKHSLKAQWYYYRYGNASKRQIVYNKLVYKYIYDHKMCLDNFF